MLLMGEIMFGTILYLHKPKRNLNTNEIMYVTITVFIWNSKRKQKYQEKNLNSKKITAMAHPKWFVWMYSIYMITTVCAVDCTYVYDVCSQFILIGMEKGW